MASAECHGNADVPLRDSDRSQRELADAIKRRIEARAGGQIQALHVDVTGGQVAIRGSASCYYHKQLAFQGLLDTNGALGARRVDFNIDVVGTPAKAGPNDADLTA